MVLNYIWIAFFLIAFVIAAVRLVFMGDVEVFPAMMNSTFDSSKTAFEISLGLTGVLSLWLGIMKIGEKGGVVNVLARVLSPMSDSLQPHGLYPTRLLCPWNFPGKHTEVGCTPRGQT